MNPSGPPPPPSPHPSLHHSQYPPEKSATGILPPPPPYDPSKYASPIPPDVRQGQGGYLALVDEDTGEEVGVVDQVHVSGAIKPGSHEPVQVELPPAGSDGIVTIRPSDEEYLRDSKHPAFANSSLVQTAAMASRFIVTAATYAAKAMEVGAQTFVQKTKPVAQPITFKPATHERVKKIHRFTSGAANVSTTTLGRVQYHAQNIGAKVVGKNEERGPRDRTANPGIVSKGLIAVGTIADGVDHASRMLLNTSSQAATTIVGHRYGEEAREVARGITGAAKNVGLVYVDASGVSRRAIVKSVAKGMVVGRVRGGGEVIVQGGEYSGSSHVDVVGAGTGGTQLHHPPLHHAKTWSAQETPHTHSPAPQYLAPHSSYSSGYGSGRSSPVPTLQTQNTGASIYATPSPTPQPLHHPGTPHPHPHSYTPQPGTPQPHSYPPPPPPHQGTIYKY